MGSYERFRLILVSASETEVLNKTCKKILEIGPKVQFVGVISKMGRLIASSHKDGVNQGLDKTDLDMLFMEVAIRVGMRSQFDSKLGTVDFTVSRRKNIVLMSFPHNDHIFYVFADKGTNIDSVTKKILELLRRTELT